MQYLFVREAASKSSPPAGGRTAGDLVLVLLHDMAALRSLALGELRVRQRMREVGIAEADCETLCGNLAHIATQGPRNPEEREILAFYFALGLRGKIREATGARRDRVTILLRETLDFLAVVYGPRALQHLTLLDEDERQMVWDLIGGTVMGLAREVAVPGVEPVGALGRWCGLFAAAPRPDRRVVAHALLSNGTTQTARIAVVGILDPVADADLLAGALAHAHATPFASLADALETPLELPVGGETTPTPLGDAGPGLPGGPEPLGAGRADASTGPPRDVGAPGDAAGRAPVPWSAAGQDRAADEAPGAASSLPGPGALGESPSSLGPVGPQGLRDGAPQDASRLGPAGRVAMRIAAFEESLGAGDEAASDAEPAPDPDVTLSGRVVRVRSPGRRLLRRLTGWAIAERVLQAFGSVFLGLRREATVRLTRQGLVYDEALWMLGRAVLQRTVGIPFEAVAARLDRRQGMVTLLVGLAAAAVAAFVAVLWGLDGLRSGYAPFLLLAAGVLAAGVAIDLLLYRVAGRLRGRAHLTLDGGVGARIRLEGVRREEAEALLTALAGPSRFQ